MSCFHVYLATSILPPDLILSGKPYTSPVLSPLLSLSLDECLLLAQASASYYAHTESDRP